MNKDFERVQRVVNGDRQAFKELYELYSEKVLNTALGFTKHIQDAEEVVQEVFTKVYLNASKFKGDSSFGTWIYRITVNSSLNAVKKKKRLRSTAISEIQEGTFEMDHPGVLLEHKEMVTALFSAIDGLSENQRVAFVLSYIEALPRQEVADIMELSLKAVESLLQRGKKNLRNILGTEYNKRRN